MLLLNFLVNVIRSKAKAKSASSQKDTKLVIKEAVHSLLRGIDYAPPADADEAHKATLEIAEILRSDYSMYPGRNSAWFESATLHGAAMGALCYRRHSQDVQLLIARFTWYTRFLVLLLMFLTSSDRFTIYFDDVPAPISKFQRSILSLEKADEPVLQSFRDLFPEIYRLWENISANGIVSSAIEFVNGCVLEDIQAVRELKVSLDAQSWPYYLREKTGCASAFSYFIFPQDSSYDVPDYIQVIGDIMIFINLSNDVLSMNLNFYKEEIVGKTRNYVHNRSKVYGKAAADTLGDVSRDAVAAYSRVTNILKSRSATCCESWQSFAAGYMYVRSVNTYVSVTDACTLDYGISLGPDTIFQNLDSEVLSTFLRYNETG
ncbi:hypothetical protein H0H92_008564 [Tricholoma furcatifolium]|nr:hypothetical protein H0H92_008564 [Tricholoma furcatifolium]